jgi:hypothetical protein
MSEVVHTDTDGAIYSFFNSFGLEAFPASSVPTGSDAPNYPYITYEAPIDSSMSKVTVVADVWYRSPSWAGVNGMVTLISQTVGDSYRIECDNGGMIVRKGTPFAQPLNDPEDNMIKRKHLIFEFTYVTTY